MLTGTSYADIEKMIQSFLDKEDNEITTFYVMFYMFPNVYRVDYNSEENDYTVTLDDKDSYDEMMSSDVNNEEFIETMNSATIKIDNLNVYMAFNHITDTRTVDSISEIDDLRSRYTATMDEIILETYDEDIGDELIFSKVLFGENDSDDEDNESKYIISHYTSQNENLTDDNMKALPSIETITFTDPENVDLMVEELVSLGFGSTYSILESIAKRPQFIQASQESIDNELVIDSEYVEKEIGEEVNNDEVVSEDELAAYNSYMQENSDGVAVFGAKKKTSKKKKSATILKITTTNINRAFKQLKKKLNMKPEDYDKLLSSMPLTTIKGVYSYDGIEKICKRSGKTYHMICLGTCYCYEIKKNNKSFTIKPRGRGDTTIHDWLLKYKNTMLLYNSTIANSFARVKEKITIKKLSDIDETIYKAWQQLKAYTLNFLVKGEIKPVTLVGSTVQTLYESVVTDSKTKAEYQGGVQDEVGIIGWDGSDLYYAETNKTARYKLDTNKVMRGLESLLKDQDLLGKMESWSTKKQKEKDKKNKSNKKSTAKAKAKLKQTKVSYGINQKASIETSKITVTTKDINDKK